MSFGVGMLVCFGVDLFFYEAPTCAPWNFFYVNIVQNVSARYGTSPWHWLFSNALPTMLGSYSILLLHSELHVNDVNQHHRALFTTSPRSCGRRHSKRIVPPFDL